MTGRIRRAGAGRPPLGAERMPLLSVRVPRATLTWIERVSAERDRTLAQVVRAILDEVIRDDQAGKAKIKRHRRR